MHPLAVLKKSYIDSTKVHTESLLNKNKIIKLKSTSPPTQGTQVI